MFSRAAQVDPPRSLCMVTVDGEILSLRTGLVYGEVLSGGGWCRGRVGDVTVGLDGLCVAVKGVEASRKRGIWVVLVGL